MVGILLAAAKAQSDLLIILQGVLPCWLPRTRLGNHTFCTVCLWTQD